MLVDSLDILLWRESVLNTLLQCPPVTPIIKQDSIRLPAVTSGTPGLLKVGLQRTWAVKMDNHPHIRLVDSHAESVCRNYDPYSVVLPVVLPLVLDGRLQPGMIPCGRNSIFRELLRDILCPLSATAVDDCCLRNGLKDMHHFSILVFRLPDNIGKVLPLETHAENIFHLESQTFLNVINNLRRGRCRQCKDRCFGYQPAYGSNLQVRGTEIITPLADAVGFVNSDEADLHVPQLYLKDVRPDALR